MASPPSRGRQALFLAVVLVVALVLAEGVARLLAPRRPRPPDSPYVYSADREVLYEHRPLAELPHGRRSNRDGLIADREYAVPKPPGVYRIASLGDSVAYLSSGKTYAQLLQERLDALPARGVRFEVLDFSVVGYNSRQELAVLRAKALRFQPDFVLLGYCVNDDEPAFGLTLFLTPGEHPASLGTRLHSRLLVFLINRYDRYLDWRSLTHHDYTYVERLFAALRELRDDRGTGVLVLFFPALGGEPRAQTFAMRAPIGLARREELPLLTPEDLLDHQPLEQYQRPPADGLHMNEAGHRLVAEKAFEAIRDRLPGMPAP